MNSRALLLVALIGVVEAGIDEGSVDDSAILLQTGRQSETQQISPVGNFTSNVSAVGAPQKESSNLQIDDLQQRPEFALIARRMNVSHELSKCDVSDADVAKASLSAIEKYMDEPDFCWRTRAKRVCKVWNPSCPEGVCKKCPPWWEGCVIRLSHCTTGPRTGYSDPCCEHERCQEGFFLRKDVFGISECVQRCEDATPAECGPAACSQDGACVHNILNMVVTVADAIRSTFQLLFPAGGVVATIKVADGATRKALQKGAKAGLKKVQAKMRKLWSDPDLKQKVFEKVEDALIDKVQSIRCDGMKKVFDITVGEIAQKANGHSEKDMEAFDFSKFEPTGFATAIKKSAEEESAAKQAGAWLEAAGSFDPTGWLSAAASFAKPKCTNTKRYTVKLSVRTATVGSADSDELVEASFDKEDNWQIMDNPNYGDFEKGNTDTFSLRSISRSPQSVTIRIRGSDGWAFDWASVKIGSTTYRLDGIYNTKKVQWLDNPVDGGDGSQAYRQTAKTQVTLYRR